MVLFRITHEGRTSILQSPDETLETPQVESVLELYADDFTLRVQPGRNLYGFDHITGKFESGPALDLQSTRSKLAGLLESALGSDHGESTDGEPERAGTVLVQFWIRGGVQSYSLSGHDLVQRIPEFFLQPPMLRALDGAYVQLRPNLVMCGDNAADSLSWHGFAEEVRYSLGLGPPPLIGDTRPPAKVEISDTDCAHHPKKLVLTPDPRQQKEKDLGVLELERAGDNSAPTDSDRLRLPHLSADGVLSVSMASVLSEIYTPGDPPDSIRVLDAKDKGLAPLIWSYLEARISSARSVLQERGGVVERASIEGVLGLLTKAHELRDPALVPKERAEPGPEPASEVDETDLFTSSVSRSSDVLEQVASTKEDVEAAIRAAHALQVLSRVLATESIEVEDALQAARQAAKSVYQPLTVRLQPLLSALEGKSFGSFVANERFAHELSDTLKGLGLALRCSKETCDKPAFLRVGDSRNREAGSFEFTHGSERHGGLAVIPRLELIIPARKVRRL